MIGNLDYKHPQKRVSIKISGLKKKSFIETIEGYANYKTKNNRLLTELDSGEIKVLRINNFVL